MADVIYNDNDPNCVRWLTNLAAANRIEPGHVDGRSISDIDPGEYRGFRQAHFFAGIGGWPLALGLAGWPRNRQVWTASFPCQPFSAAGKRQGETDSRHLWPTGFRIFSECRPSTIFGEQVASPDGRAWLARVRSDLETLGYEVGAADLCAAGIEAPHIRQRLFWVANRCGARLEGYGRPEQEPNPQGWQVSAGQPSPPGASRSGLANLPRDGRGRAQGECELEGPSGFDWGNEWIRGPKGEARRIQPSIPLLAYGVSARMAKLRGIGNAISPPLAAEFIRAFMVTES